MSELIIRLNIAREMAWLEDVKLKDYDVIISSHILEGLKKRFTSTLLKIKQPYIIDPYTYIFGSDLKEVRDKRWYPKLVGLYGLDLIGDPDFTTLSSDILVDENKQPTANLKEFVENVVNYQRDRIQDVYEEIFEFEEFESEQTESINFKPKCIIPPYFFLGPGSANWLSVNIECIKYALETKNEDEKIFPVIMIDKEIFSFKDDIDEILREYKIDAVDGYFVWPAYMDENSPKKSELRSFRDFVKKLSTHGKPIYNLYGGLFSLLLEDSGMKGVSHGICYGEHKDPFTIPGMVATIRYYELSIHTKVPFGRIDEIESALQLKSCNCMYCTKIYDTDEKGEQLELSAKHFLLARKKEIEDIDSKGALEFLSNLEKNASNAEKNDVTGTYSNFYEKFSLWSEVLRS